jgi:hypothetical protein
MRTLIAGLIAIALASPASAGIYGRYGLGVFNSAQTRPTETREISLGYVDQWFGPLIKQIEVGGWADSAGHGRHSSGFGSISTGIDSKPGYLVLRFTTGLSMITSPDEMLGGRFQFNQDFLMGFADKRKHIIGISYKHISSAGIYEPNKGRDMISLYMEIPW